MKKLLLTALVGSLPIIALAQTAPFSVSTNQYTAQQLVNDVLLNTSCYPATNITSKTGTDYASVNGIASFQKNDAVFPFASGIMLSNGDALNAPGPITGNGVSSGSNEWLGDADLTNTVGGYSSGTYTSRNASSLEFDFVPLKQEISLNYLFASNEYGQYQCTFSDAVVILLKDLTSGSGYMNIATIPGTVTPIATATTSSNIYNANCPSLNPQFFGTYYFNDPATAPVNYRGISATLTAQAAVVPGHTYHIKIVIADKNDPLFDSAVFFEAGSFDIGGFSDFELTAMGDSICSAEGVSLGTNLGEGYTHEWSFNQVAVDGETQNSLIPMLSGEYSVTVTQALTGCTVTKSIIVEAGEGLPLDIAISDLKVTDENNDGYAAFDLSVVTEEISNQTGQPSIYAITYYETLADAQAAANPIAFEVYTNVNANEQVLYARVDKTDSGCSDIFSFNLVVTPAPEAPAAPTGETDQTFEAGDTLADVEVEGENIQWYDNDGTVPAPPTGLSDPLPLTTVLQDGTTYYASQTVDGIESTTRLAVTVHVLLGLNDNILNNLVYYPNPVKDIINFSNTTDIDTITFTNMVGQLMLSKSIGTTTTQVNISELADGIYFAKITAQGKTKTVKIIKE
ncbi:choice-of-anchor L domain-containing protein [Flavobacterium sp. DG1-102-2]|uniref:choice-of-anchor L domain-containing protein n=1 Tax=Flavobacterium sp. DG1-102-2 TaxID=3081663 RepID=UPI00294928CA|nr:choice-of-anchor L domain-containing protein [Flavobacterium sp. DG1-102-2]MDV6169518.1 choice-of-anchor L domain-containing protein [Flavobacterium sp. DG1-102-2]